MNFLEQNQYIFTWLSICQVKNESAKWKKHFRLIITSLIIITECLALLASSLFIYRFVESDLPNCLYALFQVAALFSAIYMWIVAFILRHRISKMFAKFQAVYQKSNVLLKN